MTSNELRAGNWIQINDGNQIKGEIWTQYQVDSILTKQCHPLNGTNDWDYIIINRTVGQRDIPIKCVHGILLTEEWLLKFPKWFQESIRGGFYNYMRDGDTYYGEIKFVHTAQNLHFALTQTELSIETSSRSL